MYRSYLGFDVADAQKRFYAIKLFERDDKIAAQMKSAPNVEAIISKAEKEMDDDSESIITNERYSFIGSIIGDCLKKNKTQELTTSDNMRAQIQFLIRLTESLQTVFWLCQSSQ